MSRNTIPPISSPMKTGHSRLERAPAFMSTTTGALASAFMITTAQLPDRRSHSSCCSPAPLADAAQNGWSAGLAGTWVPATSR